MKKASCVLDWGSRSCKNLLWFLILLAFRISVGYHIVVTKGIHKLTRVGSMFFGEFCSTDFCGGRTLIELASSLIFRQLIFPVPKINTAVLILGRLSSLCCLFPNLFYATVNSAWLSGTNNPVFFMNFLRNYFWQKQFLPQLFFFQFNSVMTDYFVLSFLRQHGWGISLLPNLVTFSLQLNKLVCCFISTC